MLLKYFYDDRLAQASYLVGCVKTGEALVIDPARDIAPYLKAAAEAGLSITHVCETHIHADFVSGSRELASRTGAQIYLSGTGGPDWQYAYAADSAERVVTVFDGDAWRVGNVRVEVLATPGHTPEHIAFMITDTAAADRPIGIFTGDCLFVGDVGRPDLLEAAAGVAGSAATGALRQFDSVQRLKGLDDYLQIWPGHGAGSACGKALGAIPSSTLGYEKRFNPAFGFDDATEFSAWLLAGQPEPPRYFEQMKRVNKAGPALLGELPTPVAITRQRLMGLASAGEQVYDLRGRDVFAAAHLPGVISVPAQSSAFTTFLGWLVDYKQPVHLIMPDEMDGGALLGAIRAIGVDNIGSIAGPEIVPGPGTQALPSIDARELADRAECEMLTVLDVRNQNEVTEARIAGALHIHLGALRARLDEIPRHHPVVTQCATGYRSQIAASLLRSLGLSNVITLRDGRDRWAQTMPVESGEQVTAGMS
jgi:hydroxyacylglutathione hydrolase